jgi:hypothetical protein
MGTECASFLYNPKNFTVAVQRPSNGTSSSHAQRGSCLDVNNGNGPMIDLWDCHPATHPDAPHQRFTHEPSTGLLHTQLVQENGTIQPSCVGLQRLNRHAGPNYTTDPPQCYYSAPAANISTVYIIDMDHLDVGYHGLVKDVVNRYFDEFWPRAMRVAKELRDDGHSESYTYTTFSWLVSTFLSCPPHAGLHCPNATYKEEVVQAMRRGEMTWNAFPFDSGEWAPSAVSVCIQSVLDPYIV